MPFDLRRIGQMLKETREEKGLTLDEISKTLVIKKQVILAIEAGDWEKLPPPVYVKGYVNQYAAMLHVIDLLQAVIARPESPPPEETERIAAEERHERAPRGWTPKSAKIAVAVVVAAIAVGFVVLLNLPRTTPVAPPAPTVESTSQPVQTTPGTEAALPVASPKTSEQAAQSSPAPAKPSPPTLTAAPAQPSPTPAKPSASAQPTASAQPSPTPAEEAAKPLLEPKKLTIACEERTWVRIVIDGQEEKEFMLNPEDVVKLEAKDNFDLLVGNAAGVKLFLNGIDTGFSGEIGEVKHVRLP